MTEKANIILDASKIDLLLKIIDSNGCWIPKLKPTARGYVHIKINGVRYLLHRLSMCSRYDIDYFNYKVSTRHSNLCPRKCFNPEHLKPGSCSDNINDQVEHGVHRNSSKSVCPMCGNLYRQYRIKSGPRKGQLFRQCTNCKNEYRRRKYHGK